MEGGTVVNIWTSVNSNDYFDPVNVIEMTLLTAWGSWSKTKKVLTWFPAQNREVLHGIRKKFNVLVYLYKRQRQSMWLFFFLNYYF